MSSNTYDGIMPTRCLYCILILTFTPLILCLSILFTYIGLGINYLVNDYNIRELCGESILWDYVLVSVIFSPLFFTHFILKRYTKVSLESRFKILVGSVFLYLGIVFTGGFGLYDHSLACDNDNLDLWKFGISSFILQILYLFYCFIYYLDYILPEDTPIEENNSSPEFDESIFTEDPTTMGQVSII